MAEAIVSFVVAKLGDLLIEKITFLRDIRGKLESLQNELESIKGFLKTADSIHNQNQGIRVWVAEVRDIAYDVDDIIDAFLLKVTSKEGEGSDNVLKQKVFTSSFYDIGKEIDNIFEKLEEIYKRRKRYGITGVVQKEGTISSPLSEMPLRRVYPHTDDYTVGLEDQTNTLVAELLKEEDRLCVISIHGIGGLGKSTLAKKVYNHLDVKSHFDCYAWTSISQKMNTKVVLQEILRKVSTLTSEGLSHMTEVELFEKLYEILRTNRYLVVLDDIWSKEAWDVLKPAFPNNKGSKVMFTTRNLDVVEYADRWSFHLEPRSLNDNEAWELLCRKAFPPNVSGSSWSSSGDFEECGRNIVKKCGGFPLQVIVLGGILSSKGTIEEWEAVSKQIGTHTSHGQGDEVFSILSLSYNELPYNLKPLFLYLGLFPEDFLIPVKKLVRMWMAESLIRQENEGETIEEVGTRYLDELIHRSMVQIGEKSMGGKKIRTCQLHDKMRQLCITIGREENFLEEINGNGGSCYSARTSNKLRRCAIYIEQPCEQIVFPKQLAQSLRAAIFIQRGLPFSIINFKDFKILKVLHLYLKGHLSFENKNVSLLGKLTNLRYLRILSASDKYLGPEILVKFFKNLVCLQTLDLRDYVMDGKEIFNTMHQLRHLYGREIKLSTINKMSNLQTLCNAWAGPWMTDLVKLTNLEKLGIKGLHEKTSRLLTMAIGGDGLNKLRSLYLQVYYAGFPLDLLEALSGKRHLKKLKLRGEISKLPSQFPSNLIKLSLEFTDSSEDLMPTLEKLQHLLFLELSYRAYVGKQMVCSAKGFPKLEHLKFWSLFQLEEWTVEKGAMPCLTKCSIKSCDNLKMVPQGFKFLTMLQELKIIGMPKSFNERVKQGGVRGEDWETIQHIPSVTTI